MRLWSRALGVTIGLGLAAAILSLTGGPRAEPARGPLLSDCDGALRSLVIQHVPDGGPIVERAYREFLGQLPPSVTVHVVCPDQVAYDDLLLRVGRVSCRLRPVLTGHAMTCWSRDRWLALARADGPTTLLSPVAEAAAALWPQRAGDARIGDDLARALPRRVVAERSALHFDGGDFVADDRTVFVASAVLRRNRQRTVADAAELTERLERLLGKRVVLLHNSPDHHAGMFLMAVGNHTVLVGDPSLARPLLSTRTPDATPLLGPGVMPDFTEATQERFDGVAGQCEAAGYRVVRIPVVPGADGRTYLTWLNVVLDEREGRRIVYLPTYGHVPALNAAAERIWRGLGYEVRPVDCSAVYRHYGTLRCLVNVLSRG